MRISLAAAWRRRGIGSAMLGELERRLVAAGVHRIRCLLGGGSEIGALALEHAGYSARQGMVFYERLEPVDPGSAGVLGQLGGRGHAGRGQRKMHPRAPVPSDQFHRRPSRHFWGSNGTDR